MRAVHRDRGVTDFGRTSLAGEEQLAGAVEPETHQTIGLAGQPRNVGLQSNVSHLIGRCAGAPGRYLPDFARRPESHKMLGEKWVSKIFDAKSAISDQLV